MVILDESGLACVIAEQPLIDEADTVEINDIVLIHNPVAKSAWIKELGCNFYIMAGGVICKMLVVNAGEDESQIMQNLPKFSRIGSLSLLSVLNSPNASKNYHYHFFGKLSVVGDSVYLPQKSLTIWKFCFCLVIQRFLQPSFALHRSGRSLRLPARMYQISLLRRRNSIC